MSNPVSIPATKEERYRMVENWVLEGDDVKLIPLLNEANPFFDSVSANQVMRIKGFILASFEQRGTPAGVLPFVLEELENSTSPYMIGAAARALRGYAPPVQQGVSMLQKAAENLVHGDDSFSFNHIAAQGAALPATSALTEILRTFSYYGSAAKESWTSFSEMLVKRRIYLNGDARELVAAIENGISEGGSDRVLCCGEEEGLNGVDRQRILPKERYEALKNVVFEDEAGRDYHYFEYFTGAITVVTFFYTRCNNPNKCSLTITRLAELQRKLEKEKITGVKIAAITYDSDFDQPYMLRNYCEKRQFRFHDRAKAFRLKTGYNDLKAYLDLGVNYINRIVNRHTIELYILDSRGRVVNSFRRVQWDEGKVLAAILALTTGRGRFFNRIRGGINSSGAVIYAVALAFFPKCPFCLMAYLSAVGITGLNVWSFSKWLMPAIILLLVINVYVLLRRCVRRNFYWPLVITCAGVMLLLLNQFLYPSVLFKNGGLILMMAGALLNSVGKTDLVYFFNLIKRPGFEQETQRSGRE